jgi:hypothetical protein
VKALVLTTAGTVMVDAPATVGLVETSATDGLLLVIVTLVEAVGVCERYAYVETSRAAPVVMDDVWMLIGGAVTVAVICCADAGVAVLKPEGVEMLMLLVPLLTGWKFTDFR